MSTPRSPRCRRRDAPIIPAAWGQHKASRLALGEVYTEKFGRQMLVLDDVLVYTDPERHERMLEILKIASQKLQIVILTSRPQFYRGIVGPEHEFDIPALVREGVA